MKNKVLFIINILAILTCAIGVCLADSNGIALKIALVMMLVPMAWGVLFLFANRGRWE